MIETLVLILLGALLLAGEVVDMNMVEPPKPIDTPITLQEVYEKTIPTLDSYPVTTIDAEKWMTKYCDNMQNLDAMKKMQKEWDGHFIKLIGKVSNVRNSMVDGCYISIHQQRKLCIADGWIVILCYFYDDAEIEKAMQYKKGDEITIFGYAKWNMGPELLNCTVR